MVLLRMRVNHEVFPSDCCRLKQAAETQQLMHISDLGKCVPPESNSTGRSWQSCSDR